MKKNKALAITLLVLIAAIITVFIVFVRPLLVSETTDEPAETQEGESIGTLGKYRIYDKIDRSSIARIEVNNPLGKYAFVRGSDGDFVIEGMEDLPYNQKYFSALVSVVGNPLALYKVASNADRYEEYGLADSNTYWIVTDTSGKEYKITIGYMTHTAGGYYVCYEGRDAVYMLGGNIADALELTDGGTSIDDTVLRPIEFYVSPVLIAGISQNDYYKTDKFLLFRDGDPFVALKTVDKEDQINPSALVENVLTYPAAYNPNSDYYYDILKKVVTLSGESTVLAGATDEDYAKYGLEDPKYIITFVFEETSYMILAGEAGEDGSRYATSSMNPTVIAKVSSDYLGFLEDDLISWVSRYPFEYNISSVEHIAVSGKGVSLDFTLRHGATDSSGKTELTVDASDELTGQYRTIAEENDVWNFRSFYRTMLYTQIEEDAPLSADEAAALTADESNCVLTFEYTLDSGKVHTLKFWQYSTRRTLLTIDGSGQYYVYLDRAEKILSDAIKAFKGEEIDSHAKN